MALSNLYGWNEDAETPAASCGTACGAQGDFYDADPQCWKEIPDNYSAIFFVIPGYIDGEQPASKPRRPGRVRIDEG